MYPAINSSLMGNDLTYLFFYVNQVTNGLFMPFFVYAFFLVVFLSSLMFQLKFNSRIRPEVSLLASAFVSLGLLLILNQVTGIVDPIHFVIMTVIFIGSAIWVINSSGE